MNVGLPGTGIAGIFYVLAALWMPFHALLRTLRGERDAARWRLALTRAALAVCIIAAIAATTWAIGLLAPLRFAPTPAEPGADAGGTTAGMTTAGAVRTFGIAPGIVALATFVALVLLLELAALIVARHRRHSTPRSA